MNGLISTALLGIIGVAASAVIIYWHVATRGTWREWPAGRSLMGLLAIIALGFLFGLMNRLIPFPLGRSVVAVVLYGAFVWAIIFVGLTIRKEMRAGKARLNDKFPSHTPTGPVTVIVATKNEEIPDVNPTP